MIEKTKKVVDENIDEINSQKDKANVSKSDFNPLGEPVVKREYTKPNFEDNNVGGEIQEPTFKTPNLEDFEQEFEKEDETKGGGNSFNESVNELDKKEQKVASEQMVDTVLEMYGQAHKLANNYVKIKPQKIVKAMQEGKINPSIQVPADEYGSTIGLLDYVNEYNEQLSEAIELEDEFLEKVKPPMIRVFQKRGISMTDEQYLMFAFGSDIVTKGAMLFQLKSQNNQMMKMWMESSPDNQNKSPKKKSENTETKQESKKDNPEEYDFPVSKKEEKKEYREPEEFTAETMVNDMMGSDTTFEESPVDPSMPNFGDAEVLKSIDDIERQSMAQMSNESKSKVKKSKVPENGKPKRGRPKKKK